MISDIRVEMPQLKVPISLMVDDSTPGTERYEEIDEALKGYMPGRLSRLISVIKEKIAANFDITPEILTHNQVVDVEGVSSSDFISPAVSEPEWSKSQDRGTLT